MLKPTPNRRLESMLRMLPVLMLMSLLMGGCAILGKGTSTRFVDTSCSAFKAITYSSRDTPETIKEVREHNRVVDRLCPAS